MRLMVDREVQVYVVMIDREEKREIFYVCHLFCYDKEILFYTHRDYSHRGCLSITYNTMIDRIGEIDEMFLL